MAGPIVSISSLPRMPASPACGLRPTTPTRGRATPRCLRRLVTARSLAEDNGVAERCRFETAGFEALEAVSGDFDVALANIYADVIAENVTLLRAGLAPEGGFAFSGCPADHAPVTRAAIEAAGLVVEEQRQRGRWTTFLGVKLAK